MGSKIAYSGISAKLKAMESRLLSPVQYEELAGCSSVGDAVAYLKNLSAYSDCLAGYDSAGVHREQLERVISGSLQSDFIRLYKFANAGQKQFLNIY
ncbi:MAG: V-type ATPase subunit, partial [Lachnospiraceae bacterium]